MLLNEFGNTTKVSTLNTYLMCLKGVAKYVMGVKEFRGTIETQPQRRNDPVLLKFSDVSEICCMLMQDGKHLTAMFGLFLFLLVTTAARNSTIRQIRFDQFVKNDQGGCDVHLLETKTGKARTFRFGPFVWNQISKLQSSRQEEQMKIID